MQSHRVIEEIISRVKATPGMEHLLFERRSSDRVDVYGKYGLIESAVYMGSDERIFHEKGRVIYNIDDSIERIIRLARLETRPDSALNQFYKERFPSLASEVDFSHYSDYLEPIRLACHMDMWSPELDRLLHFDRLAYERKLRTAIQGHPLPMPIADAIIDVVKFG